MGAAEDFERQVEQNKAFFRGNEALRTRSIDWMLAAAEGQYSYNFRWMGRPIIQYPSDIVAFQELVWQVRPDVIVETGVAHGGSAILSASLLAMLDYCDAVEKGTTLDPRASQRKVVAVDIDIRAHNRERIEAHPLAHLIELVQGSSIDDEVLAQVRKVAEGRRTLVCLDSNHTHEHVLRELELYAPLVSSGSYCVVFDTLVEDLPESASDNRPWGPGNSPKTAVWEYLKQHPEFTIDHDIESKLLVTVAPDGYLKRA